jgi:hypothetical protein
MAAAGGERFIVVSKRYRDYDVRRWLRQTSRPTANDLGKYVE